MLKALLGSTKGVSSAVRRFRLRCLKAVILLLDSHPELDFALEAGEVADATAMLSSQEKRQQVVFFAFEISKQHNMPVVNCGDEFVMFSCADVDLFRVLKVMCTSSRIVQCFHAQAANIETCFAVGGQPGGRGGAGVQGGEPEDARRRKRHPGGRRARHARICAAQPRPWCASFPILPN